MSHYPLYSDANNAPDLQHPESNVLVIKTEEYVKKANFAIDMSQYALDSDKNNAPDLQHRESNVLLVQHVGDHVRKAGIGLPLFEELHGDDIPCPLMTICVTCFPPYSVAISQTQSHQTGHREMRCLPNSRDFTKRIQEGFRLMRPLNKAFKNTQIQNSVHYCDKSKEYRPTETCIGIRRMQVAWVGSLCIFMFRFQRNISTADRGGGAQNVIGVSGCFKIFSFEEEFEALLHNPFYAPDINDALRDNGIAHFDLVDERLRRNGITINEIDNRDRSVRKTIKINLQGNIFAPPTGKMQLEGMDSWDEKTQFCVIAMMIKECAYVFEKRRMFIDKAKQVLVAYVTANNARNQYIALVRASELVFKRRRLY
jgi:hypothetical protein